MIRLQGTPLTFEETYRLWYDSPVLATPRVMTAPHDFGDTRTVGAHLKRSGVPAPELQDNLDFGIFLGQHADRWVVGVLSEDCTKFAGGEWFHTLSDLKQIWELD